MRAHCILKMGGLWLFAARRLCADWLEECALYRLLREIQPPFRMLFPN